MADSGAALTTLAAIHVATPHDSAEKHVAGEAIYIDDTGGAGKVSLLDGTATAFAGNMPTASAPHLTADPGGAVWFSMLGYDLVGAAKLDLSSGAVRMYPFPQPDAGGAPAPAPGGCPLSPSGCDMSKATFDPQIQAMALDAHGNLWVITRLSGSGDPHSFIAMSPIYELPQGA